MTCLARSIKTFLGDMITNEPKAAPQMITNSERCSSASGWPPPMTNPPMTEPSTINAPTITIMSQGLSVVKGLGVLLFQERLDGQDGLGMNLADARFGHAERGGDFAQAQILKIIKGEHLALHLGQLLQPLLNQAGHLAPGRSLPGLGLRIVRDKIIASAGV